MGYMGGMDMPGGDFMQGGMMGGPNGMGQMGGMGGIIGGNAAAQGRKLLVDGLQGFMNDQVMGKYFQKFGQLVDWGRDKAGGGYVVFTDPAMADYCVRRQNHQINGKQIYVVKANAS